MYIYSFKTTFQQPLFWSSVIFKNYNRIFVLKKHFQLLSMFKIVVLLKGWYFFPRTWIESLKDHNLFEIESLCNIINVFAVSSSLLSSLPKKKYNFFIKNILNFDQECLYNFNGNISIYLPLYEGHFKIH